MINYGNYRFIAMEEQQETQWINQNLLLDPDVQQIKKIDQTMQPLNGTNENADQKKRAQTLRKVKITILVIVSISTLALVGLITSLIYLDQQKKKDKNKNTELPAAFVH